MNKSKIMGYLSALGRSLMMPVIALAATAIFLVALVFSPKQGLLWRKLKKQLTNN